MVCYMTDFANQGNRVGLSVNQRPLLSLEQSQMSTTCGNLTKQCLLNVGTVS